MKRYKDRVTELERKVEALEIALYKGVMPYVQTPENPVRTSTKIKSNKTCLLPKFNPNKSNFDEGNSDGASKESGEDFFVSPLISECE